MVGTMPTDRWSSIWRRRQRRTASTFRRTRMEVEGIFSKGECDAMVRLAEGLGQRGESWLATGVGVATTASEAE